MDLIFKALADPTRRHLMDCLREKDGQTVSDLVPQTELTRFGVMKHLKLLEEATLIVSVKSGRFKHHYLNAASVQDVVDRWVEPFIAAPLAKGLTHLKRDLERQETEMTEKPDFVMETYIKTTPEALWQALTDRDISSKYNVLAGGIESDFKKGSEYRHVLPDGSSILSGEILDVEPLKKLDMSFAPGWGGANAKISRAVYEIEHLGDVCKLRVLHFGIPEGQEGVRDGWVKIISNLKSYLETGAALDFNLEMSA